MDSKGEQEEITYPKLYFAIDGFEEVLYKSGWHLWNWIGISIDQNINLYYLRKRFNIPFLIFHLTTQF